MKGYKTPYISRLLGFCRRLNTKYRKEDEDKIDYYSKNSRSTAIKHDPLVISGVKEYILLNCSDCHYTNLLPIGDLAVSALGLVAALILFFVCFSNLHYYAIVLALLFSCISCYLQVYRYIKIHAFCFLCLSVTFVFYLTLGLLLIEYILKPGFSRKFGKGETGV